MQFEAVSPDPAKQKEFANHTFAFSAAECALLCYNSKCTAAGYMAPTPIDLSDPGVCLLSFGAPSCIGQAKVDKYNTTGNVQMQCIECTSAGGNVREGTVEVTGSTSPTIEVTVVSNVNATAVRVTSSGAEGQGIKKC